MSDIEAIGLGALNTDFLYKVERILDDEETTVDEAKLSPGGSAANTIYGLAKLGVKSGFIGAVGDDAEGEVSIQDFRKVGVDTSQIKIKAGAKTGSVLCLSDQAGKRSLYVIPGANNLLAMEDLDVTYINRAKILHISSFANDSQFKLTLELIGKLNPTVEVSFTPGALYASKGIEALTPILKRTYTLFINQNELRQLTCQGITDGAEICLKQGCRIVAVTLGKGTSLVLCKANGSKEVAATSYIRDADNEYAIKPTGQNITSEIDTTGAGDAFATGFIYGLLKEKNLEVCGRLGDLVARFSITKTGARQNLPNLNELAKRYREIYSEQL